MSEGQRPTSGRGKKAICQSDYSLIHAIVTLFYRTLKLTQGYDKVGDGCRQQCCIQNCSQTAADKNVVTFDSLCNVAVALSNNTIVDPL